MIHPLSRDADCRPRDTPESGPRSGVVLAARPGMLRTVGGMPLVERAVRMLLAGGLERVVVVVGEQGEAVARAARRAAPRDSPERVQVLRSDAWEKGNGASLAAAAGAVAGEPTFLVVGADIVFTAGALAGLLRSPRPAYLAAAIQDRSIDAGAFVFGPEIFDHIRRAQDDGDATLLGAFWRMEAAEGSTAVPPSPETSWRGVQDDADVRAARQMLRRSLGKSSDGPVSQYLNRPISSRITMALSPLRVPPGVITVVAGMMGLAAAWGLAWGQGLFSGLLIQATNVLDGADGETSRLHFRSSRRGALIDAAVDRIVDGSLVAGVGLWLWPFHPSLEFKVAILSSSAYGWGFIAYLFQSKLTGLEVSGADRPLVMLLGGRDSRLLILAVGTMLYQPGAAVAGGWIIYLSSVLRRVFLVRRGPRTSPAATTPPDEVGESPQRDLREER